MSTSALEMRFDDLCKLLKSSGLSGWDSVYFIEDFFIEPSSIQSIKRSRLLSANEFSDRFDTLLSQGHSWINMSGLGLLENDLIVAIESPPEHSSSFACGASNTSVNFSGPMRMVKDKNYNLIDFIDVEE